MSTFKFKNISPKKSSDEKDLIELVEELTRLISNFVGSSIFKRDIFDKSDEDHYTETLIKYLENENTGSRFSFKQQASLPKRRSTDIGVHLKADSEHYIFCIEAKFLPPKDYVTGGYAAIKRFKKREHGISNRNPKKAKNLPESAIIGYSKSGTFNGHFNAINTKVQSLSSSKVADKFGIVWKMSEQLQQVNMNKIAVLFSNHSCTDKSEIKLHHFWVKV